MGRMTTESTRPLVPLLAYSLLCSLTRSRAHGKNIMNDMNASISYGFNSLWISLFVENGLHIHIVIDAFFGNNAQWVEIIHFE